MTMLGHDRDSNMGTGHRGLRLPKDVNRILYVKNLPFKIKDDQLYEIFGKHGAIRQIRRGSSPTTRGTAFVIYEDIYEAKAALENLNGMNVMDRYLIILFWNRDKWLSNKALQQEKKRIQTLRQKYLSKQ